MAADAGVGDRVADRLAVHDEPAAGAAAGDPPGVRRGELVDRTVYEPGQIAQRDLWFPEPRIPVAAGQKRMLPVLVMTCAFFRYTCAVMIHSRQGRDILIGMWQLIRSLGRVIKTTRSCSTPPATGSPPRGAHQAGRLDAELKKIRRYRLIFIDEVGHVPFDQDAANLFFQLIASGYEIGSVMVTSNLSFGRWGETFSDDVVAAAMIDRLVHHARCAHPDRRLPPHPPTPRTAG